MGRERGRAGEEGGIKEGKGEGEKERERDKSKKGKEVKEGEGEYGIVTFVF